ncbi:hypothetical protein KQX54_012313 [Cotesia glomerata]|uniref:Uncharacterized protein n=1 Tax=Cotesia glomerata TaxID=32391 RepID=A0AAV7IEZ1_COTGL|nr:hypothetical protein KQX54_012313 [Cotesia glomerata]
MRRKANRKIVPPPRTPAQQLYINASRGVPVHSSSSKQLSIREPECKLKEPTSEKKMKCKKEDRDSISQGHRFGPLQDQDRFRHKRTIEIFVQSTPPPRTSEYNSLASISTYLDRRNLHPVNAATRK